MKIKGVFFLYILLITACGGNNHPSFEIYSTVKPAMGTYVGFKISLEQPDNKPPHSRAGEVYPVIDKTYKEIKRLEFVMSGWIDSSPLSVLNEYNDTVPHQVPGELFTLIKKSLEISKNTGGAFDITVYPLVNLWKKDVFPDKKEITDTLKKTGYEYILLNSENRTIRFLKKNMMIDLNGIAKGYIIQRAGEFLYKLGYHNFIINAGGDLTISGIPRPGALWNIGIQHPQKKTGDVIEKLRLSDISAATSGNYENYKIVGGRKIGHIINPLAGYPEERFISATVTGPDLAVCDALSTAFTFLSEESITRTLKNYPYYSVILYTNSLERISYP